MTLVLRIWWAFDRLTCIWRINETRCLIKFIQTYFHIKHVMFVEITRVSWRKENGNFQVDIEVYLRDSINGYWRCWLLKIEIVIMRLERPLTGQLFFRASVLSVFNRFQDTNCRYTNALIINSKYDIVVFRVNVALEVHRHRFPFVGPSTTSWSYYYWSLIDFLKFIIV